MEDFIAKIENIDSVSVFLTQDRKEIFAFHGEVKEVVADSEIINLDLNQCEITIDRSWGIIQENEGDFIFDCGNGVWLYIYSLS